MKKKLLFISSLLCLSFIGCADARGDDSMSLRLAVNDASTTLNFLYTILEPNVTIITNLQEGLVQYDESSKLIPMTAKAWNISEDKRTYTFSIRDDATWQNGTAVTADDFVYSIRTRIQDPQGVYAEYYKCLANGEAVLKGEMPITNLGVKAVDDKTLVFVLDEPKASFLDLLAFEIFLPLNQKFYEEVGAENYGTSADTFLANGAYTLLDYNGVAGWTLRKNPNYWNAAKTALENIEVRVIKENATRELMWQNDELDIFEVSSDIMDNYKDDVNLQSVLKSQMNYLYLSDITGKNPILANKNFRAAIAHSIDKRLIVDTILKDGSIAADYFVAQDILFQNGKDFRTMSNTFDTPMFNVQTALTYLRAAKAELQQDTVVFALETYDLGKTKNVYDNIKAQIEQNLPGVNVRLILNPTQTHFQKLYEYQTPAAASQWQPDYLDVENYFLPFQSEASQNFAQWHDARYDGFYQEAESVALSMNPLKRWRTYAEAEQVLIEDYTIIPLYQSGSSYLKRENVNGYYQAPSLPSVMYKYISKT